MPDVLNQHSIRTARAKGLPEPTVLWLHALRDALLPVVAAVGLRTGLLLGGVVMRETVSPGPAAGGWRSRRSLRATSR